MSRNAMHVSVAVLFLIAITFYVLGAETSAAIFVVLGFIVELTAWVTWFSRWRQRSRPR